MDLDRHPLLSRGLVQVAGFHDDAEADMLVEEGVDWLGIPLRLTVNAEDLSEADAARISQRLPGKCCLITYLDEAAAIVELVEFLEVSILQLHGDVIPAVLSDVRRLLPDLCIVKSLVIGGRPFRQIQSMVDTLSPHVDAFITDTFNPETGAEGATGLTHDWSISRSLVQQSPKPLILAGGLHPENVSEAITLVQPAGVDVHTGVEGPDGRKSRERVRDFVSRSRFAFRGNP